MTERNSQKEKTSPEVQSIRQTMSKPQEVGAEQEVGQSNVFESNIEQPWLQPPSKEQIKQELLTKRYREVDYQKQYLRNRKEAIREILQENVQKSTLISNEELLKKFNEGKGGEV